MCLSVPVDFILGLYTKYMYLWAKEQHHNNNFFTNFAMKPSLCLSLALSAFLSLSISACTDIDQRSSSPNPTSDAGCQAKEDWDEVVRYNLENSHDIPVELIRTGSEKTRSDAVDYEISTGEQTIYLTQNIIAKKFIESGIWEEVQVKKKPHALVFNFVPYPYIEEITQPRNLVSYAIAVKKALKSEEWDVASRTKSKPSAEASFKDILDFDDLKTSFGGNLSVAKIFSANASYDKKRTKYKTAFLARLKSINFRVDTEVEDKIIADEVKDESQSYVSSIAYGKTAYLLIYSNYSYDEIKESISATLTGKIVNGGANYSKETMKIMSSSESYCWIKGNDLTSSFWGTTPDFFEKMFTGVFDKTNVGVPVFFELRSVKTNTLINPNEGSKHNGGSIGGNSRPRR